MGLFVQTLTALAASDGRIGARILSSSRPNPALASQADKAAARKMVCGQGIAGWHGLAASLAGSVRVS